MELLIALGILFLIGFLIWLAFEFFEDEDFLND